MIYLGAVWPSLYTLIALVILPAPLIFAGAMMRPLALAKSPKIRAYLLICVCISIIGLVDELVWLIFLQGHRWR